MILRISRWLVRVLFVLAFAATAAVLWLLMTDSGTRFLLARAETWIPDELTISDISGSLVGEHILDHDPHRNDGLDFRHIASQDFEVVSRDAVRSDPGFLRLFSLPIPRPLVVLVVDSTINLLTI